MYEFLWLILHFDWLKNFLRTKYFGEGSRVNLQLNWDSPLWLRREANSSAKFFGDVFESRHLLRVFGRAGKAGSDKTLASKIRNVCEICLIWYAGSARNLCKASEFRQRSQIMQRNWNKSIETSVTRCVLIEMSPTCKPPSELRYESPAQANIYSGKWGWLHIRLLRFVTFVLLLFSVRHSTFLSLHLCLEWALHAVF